MALKRTSTFLALFLMLTMVNGFTLRGQSGTSSAIAGSVLDKSGAAIAGRPAHGNRSKQRLYPCGP